MISASITGGLVDWTADVFEALGLLGAGLVVVMEALIPPIPSEAVLLLAGFLVGEGRYGFIEALLVTTAASVCGALILYLVGRVVGEERLLVFLETVGRPLRVTHADLEKANRWFERHGPAVVSFGRLVPIVRSLVSIPAGADKLSLPVFVVFTAAGSSVWNAALIGSGAALGSRWEQAQRWTDVLTLIVLAIGVVALVILWVRRRRSRVPAAGPHAAE